MEKRRPNFLLTELQALLVNAHNRIITVTAFNGAHELDMGEADIVDCVVALTSSDFYKSMTTHAASRRWQDVYKATFEGFGCT